MKLSTLSLTVWGGPVQGRRALTEIIKGIGGGGDPGVLYGETPARGLTLYPCARRARSYLFSALAKFC